jgi:hypothetical protein
LEHKKSSAKALLSLSHLRRSDRQTPKNWAGQQVDLVGRTINPSPDKKGGRVPHVRPSVQGRKRPGEARPSLFFTFARKTNPWVPHIPDFL